MATYKSSHKGSQIDNAVSVANANLNRGTAETPIYYDSEGFGQAIEKDSTVTASSTKPLTSGGAYTGLNTVVDYSDIQYENFNGEFTKHGNVQIVDGIASGFSNSNYVTTANINKSLNTFKIEGEFVTSDSVTTAQMIFVTTVTDSNSTLRSLALQQYTNGTLYFYVPRSSGGDWIVGTTVLQVNTKYYFKINFDGINVTWSYGTDKNNLIAQPSVACLTSTLNNVIRIGLNSLGGGPFLGSIDLKQFSITVDGKLVYTPYPNPALPPSQYAVKQYVDNSLPAKQDNLYGGYGIDVNGATVSVSDDVFREDEEARLHADLKVDHFGDMSLGTDSEVLELMNEAKHSSFYLSKFTVVGSPTITDDGIASGFSGSNYLKTQYVDLTKNFEMSIVFVAKTSSANQGIIMTDFDNFSQRQIGIWKKYDNKLNYYFSTNGTDWDVVFTGNTTLIDSNTYKLSLIKNDTLMKAILKNLDTNNTIEEFNDNSGISLFNSSKGLRLGDSSSNFWNYFTGSIDLKQFSITVDGVEAFSGNKTGIDTIKPDDYTVVGTPTISADGVASGFSSSNGISIFDHLNFSTFLSTQSFKIIAEAVLPDNFTGNKYLWLFAKVSTYLEGNAFRAQYNNYAKMLSSTNLSTSLYGKPIRVIYEVDAKNSLFKFQIINLETGTDIVNTSDNITLADLSFGGFNIGINGASSWASSIDLNAFKIYVDGNLVYQSCLKIPYTQTKDGKKIVDSMYRDRVEDEYNQLGYTPYYSIQPLDQGNYAVVGSPTISSDFVASGFSATSAIQPNYNFNNASTANSWEVRAKFETGSSVGGNQNIFANTSSNYTNFRFFNGKLRIEIGGGSSFLFRLTGTASLHVNTVYYVKFVFTGTKYQIWLSTDGITYTLDNEGNSTDKFVSQGTWSIGSSYNMGQYAFPFLGSIDLNSFKIYVDNKLVYTATPNYTMATVEEDDIVASLDGATSYAQRADLSIEQQGTTTNGTTVTFPKAFMDTNYALSIPYTAGTKTKTGFTAAADGDYIAEGNVSI